MSREIPYNPTNPRKLANEDQIQAMLARMKEGPRQVVAKPPEPEPPKPEESSIEWQKPVQNKDGTGYCLSKCGGWSVAKTRQGVQFLYAAWRIRAEWKFCVGVKTTFDDAKALCK